MNADSLVEYLKGQGVEFEPRTSFYGLRAKGSGCCPVCEVCRLLTGKLYSNAAFGYAARDVGLPEADALLVASASDHPSFLLRGRAKILRWKLEEIWDPKARAEEVRA